MVIQSNCFAAWNYGRDVGETVNLDVQRTFYLHFLVNCMGMYCQLLFFPPTGDLVLHFINSLERPQSFQKELLRLWKNSWCGKRRQFWCNQNQNAAHLFAKYQSLDPRTLLQCDDASPPAMKRVWLPVGFFFHGCRWGLQGFPSHVEVSIFGILPNSTVANPQTIAGSQWKIRLCRENHYPSKFWDACCICCSSVACIYIYISYLFLSAFCWSVFYHD